MQRRDFLRGLGILGCSAAAHPWLNTVTMAGSDGGRPLGDHRFVVMILRGAMDGLDVVQPQGAAEYAGYRPTLIQPDAPDLDGFFRLHFAMAPLLPLWAAGELGFVHATSTPYRDKRSHFDGQDMLEAGTGMDVPLDQVRDGWLNRLLQTQKGLTSQTAYSVGVDAMPILAGPAPVKEWAPETTLALTPQSQLLLERVYHDDLLFQSAALEAMELAAAGNLGAALESGMGANKAIGTGMVPQEPSREARVRDVVGLVDYAAAQMLQDARIVAFSLTGWDTHKGQASGLPLALTRLQYSILRLKAGLGPEVWGKTTVLAMTEFGRTAKENGTKGTDHGTAGLMVMAGGAIAGGKVYGQWPGLAEADLYQRRDLMPTSDVRAWAAHALRGMYGIDRAVLEGVVFPGLQMGDDPGIIR